MSRLLPIVLIVLGCLWACERPQAEPSGDVLRVCVPPDQLDPAIPRQFERVTGIRVIISNVQAAPCDLRIMPEIQVPALVQNGDVQPIDLSKVPNVQHLAARFRSLGDDSQDAHSLPYSWQTVGLLYRHDLISSPPSWATIFDAGDAPLPFVPSGDERVMTALALKHLGHSANTADAHALAAAADLLARIERVPQRRADPADAVIMVIGSAAAHRAMAKDDRLRFVIPPEGSIVRVDAMVVPDAASRPDLAHRFMDYLLDPQIAAQLANHTRAGTPNEAATPYIAPEDRAAPGLYPPPAVMETLERLEP